MLLFFASASVMPRAYLAINNITNRQNCYFMVLPQHVIYQYQTLGTLLYFKRILWNNRTFRSTHQTYSVIVCHPFRIPPVSHYYSTVANYMSHSIRESLTLICPLSSLIQMNLNHLLCISFNQMPVSKVTIQRNYLYFYK